MLKTTTRKPSSVVTSITCFSLLRLMFRALFRTPHSRSALNPSFTIASFLLKCTHTPISHQPSRRQQRNADPISKHQKARLTIAPTNGAVEKINTRLTAPLQSAVFCRRKYRTPGSILYPKNPITIAPQTRPACGTFQSHRQSDQHIRFGPTATIPLSGDAAPAPTEPTSRVRLLSTAPAGTCANDRQQYRECCPPRFHCSNHASSMPPNIIRSNPATNRRP